MRATAIESRLKKGRGAHLEVVTFGLAKGDIPIPGFAGVFPSRTYSDRESLGSSDEVIEPSETSETSSDSDGLTELYRLRGDFPAFKAEADFATMEEDRGRWGGRSAKKTTKTYLLPGSLESACVGSRDSRFRAEMDSLCECKEGIGRFRLREDSGD